MKMPCFFLMVRNAVTVALMLIAVPSTGATITLGDVTTSLSGSLFLDDARTGGGDATTHDDGGGLSPQRFFDLDGDGTLDPPESLDAPGVPGTITIQGFGFASSATADANDASQVELTFVYLGADEVVGGSDDVTIGSEIVNYNYQGAGEYFVNFDTEISASIDGLGRMFRVFVNVLDLDTNLQESIRLKQRPANEQMYGLAPTRVNGGTQGGGPSISVSGAFVAIPEPQSVALLALALCGGSAIAMRKKLG